MRKLKELILINKIKKKSSVELIKILSKFIYPIFKKSPLIIIFMN